MQRSRSSYKRRPADSRPSRRDLLAGGIGAATLLALPGTGRSQAPDPAGGAGAIRAVDLADGVGAFLAPEGNTLVADTGDGLVIADGGHSSRADRLLADIERAYPGRPVTALINSHWHPEQTGLNVVLGERGTEIIAHENTRLWLGVEIEQRWSGRRFAPLPPAGRPTTGLHASGERDFGGRRIVLDHLLHAHTDGDLCVWLPDANVLFTGGHVTSDRWPVIDWWTGGWIGGMLDGFDSLLGVVDGATRIVPARGPVMSSADLIAQHEMYLTIFDRLHNLLREAKATDEVLAARPTAEFDARFGDPERFVTLAFESMWGHLRDAHDLRMQNIP